MELREFPPGNEFSGYWHPSAEFEINSMGFQPHAMDNDD